MTIAAGFRFDGGVVLCADSEETTGNVVKVPVPKIEILDKQYSKFVLTGAGDSALLKRTFEELDKRLRQRMSDGDIRATIEHVVSQMQRQFVEPYPGPEKPAIDLLIGYQRGNVAELITITNAAVSVRVATCEVIGFGIYHATHLRPGAVVRRWQRRRDPATAVPLRLLQGAGAGSDVAAGA